MLLLLQKWAESSALFNYGQKMGGGHLQGRLWRAKLPKKCLRCRFGITEFIFHPHLSKAPELVWKKNKFPNLIITDRVLSFSVLHAFKSSSLPAPGWICPTMPQGCHSSPPWTIQPSYHRPSIINPIRSCCQMIQCLLPFLSSVGQTPHAVTCTAEMADSVPGSRWCYRRKAAPPVCEEGGRALGWNAQTRMLYTAELSL